MELIGFKEAVYFRKHLRQVKHVTMNPYGPGVVRIHLVPPKFSLNKDIPSVVILNGQDILPVNLSWAILLSAFIDEINPYHEQEIADGDWECIVSKTIASVHRVYRRVTAQMLKDDLWRIISTLKDIARGEKPQEDIGLVSIGAYAKHMKAPHRMDLMISSMESNGRWNCNQKCLHCYAAGQRMAACAELPAEAWKEIIRKCREAGIPQLTFTGGEPTMRAELVELVQEAKWFVTRLNTNGINLTEELCRALYAADLDSVQITLYSSLPAEHNALVGAENWEKTVAGIKNALSANLSVSINTPLCTINKDYLETLKFVRALGVRYLSCSGLIFAGNAEKAKSIGTQLTGEELCGILQEAFAYCKENHMEISFTSPGWVPGEQLLAYGFTSVPTCGACLSNMAVAPDGKVMPCQSWLSEDALGDMRIDEWRKIWNNPRCRQIRNTAGKMEQKCLLREKATENK